MNQEKRVAIDEEADDLPAKIHRLIVAVFLVIMALELVLLLMDQQWINAVLVIAIMSITFSLPLLGRHLRVNIPPEFQILTVVFVFAALFLGEVRDYYERIWWWDIALHASSGLLMGICGFLLVYVLNESERVDFHMRARFVAMFAFVFAVAVGALWEIFEFSMDQIFAINMQKAMLDDPSGLTDTMWDMIVNAVAAAAICFLGWRYMLRRESSFIET